ncbi:MAG: DinB family protein [Clostridia bacterium]|nr:DinB family protein [Clostridia bacterium]
MLTAHEMMGHWQRHRAVVEDILARIGDEHVDFKPWDGAMRLGELALHLAGWNHAFVQLAKTGVRPPVPKADGMTLPEIRAAIADLTDRTKSVYASLTDDDLEREHVFPESGFRATGRTILMMMFEHEIHHKGQLMLYARMVGVRELPFFVRPPARPAGRS